MVVRTVQASRDGGQKCTGLQRWWSELYRPPEMVVRTVQASRVRSAHEMPKSDR